MVASAPPFPPTLLLGAPTASGKTALALRLAQVQPGLEVVSADAFAVYRGLDIGTAKPSPSERGAVPHHLLDVADVREGYDVARWLAAAEAAIGDIRARGGVPLVVGGTGFYLQALMRGLPLTPPSTPAGRAAAEAELAARGLDAVLGEIGRLSPEAAARCQRNPRRVLRALEVYRASGRFPHEFGHAPPRFATRLVAYAPAWEHWEAGAAVRIRAMLRAGWPEEAAWLARRVSPDAAPRPTAWQALGYREALALHRGEGSEADTAALILLRSRQYARRQLTFLRGALSANVLAPDEAEALLRTLLG